MGNYRGTRACLCGCGKWVEYWEWRDDEKYWVDCIPGHKRKECVRKIPVYYSSIYLHKRAWELFGGNECEVCGLSLKLHKEFYNKRFFMHNTLNPKDYSILEKHAWQCVCIPCHAEVEKDQSFRYLEVNEDPHFDLSIETW